MRSSGKLDWNHMVLVVWHQLAVRFGSIHWHSIFESRQNILMTICKVTIRESSASGFVLIVRGEDVCCWHVDELVEYLLFGKAREESVFWACHRSSSRFPWCFWHMLSSSISISSLLKVGSLVSLIKFLHISIFALFIIFFQIENDLFDCLINLGSTFIWLI